SPWVDRSRRPATVRPDGWSSPSLAEGHRIRLTGRLVPTLPCGSCPARLDVNSFPRLRTVSYPVDISVFTFNGRGSDDYAPGPRPLAARRPRPALPGTAPPGTAVAARPCPPAGREEERMHEVGADHHRRADPGRHVLRPGLGRGRRRRQRSGDEHDAARAGPGRRGALRRGPGSGARARARATARAGGGRPGAGRARGSSRTPERAEGGRALPRLHVVLEAGTG